MTQEHIFDFMTNMTQAIEFWNHCLEHFVCVLHCGSYEGGVVYEGGCANRPDIPIDLLAGRSYCASARSY